MKLLADAPLVEVADGEYDVIVLPGGIKGAECFRDSTCWLKPLNSSTVPAYRRGYLRRASHRAGPARYLPDWQYDRLPDAERQKYPPNNGRTSASSGMHGKIADQPGRTAIDFGLKIIDLLVGREKAMKWHHNW